jgi:chloramphenicol O-acetyltransferase type B
MANSYQEIEETTWKRALHCIVFINSLEPAFCVTFELDNTNFLQRVKECGYSFTIAMVYAVCKCANEMVKCLCQFQFHFKGQMSGEVKVVK